MGAAILDAEGAAKEAPMGGTPQTPSAAAPAALCLSRLPRTPRGPQMARITLQLLRVGAIATHAILGALPGQLKTLT